MIPIVQKVSGPEPASTRTNLQLRQCIPAAHPRGLSNKEVLSMCRASLCEIPCLHTILRTVASGKWIQRYLKDFPTDDGRSSLSHQCPNLTRDTSRRGNAACLGHDQEILRAGIIRSNISW